MRKPKGVLLIALLSVAAVLAACNGANNGASRVPGPTSGPTGNCGGPPSSNQLEVLFPVPNSKNAPPGIDNIYVSTKEQLPPSNQFDFLLAESNGAIDVHRTVHRHQQVAAPSGYQARRRTPIRYTMLRPLRARRDRAFPSVRTCRVSLFWNDGGRNCVPHFLVASFRTKK